MSVETYGTYQLLKRLATGGMAQIYLARQGGVHGDEKLLVVKRILPHLAENAEFIQMFLDEARIAARLNHPNIVQIFNLGAQDDSYFIAMEYIHGEDVRRVWKRAESKNTELPVPLVCRIVSDASAGLDYAHRKTDHSGKPLGIVHRDISPQNIIISFDGAVKVVDFGIAKAADQATETRSGVLKGKYSYMSPEQASGKRLDRRSDIFALGVVLYELLTGTRLFKRGNDIMTLNAVTECQVAPPSEVNSRLPKDLDAIVMKALARSPEDRYLHASELRSALEDWLRLHQLPASSANLGAFMRQVYAERLAREAVEGRVLVDELDSSRSKDEEPPSVQQKHSQSRSQGVQGTAADPATVLDPRTLSDHRSALLAGRAFPSSEVGIGTELELKRVDTQSLRTPASSRARLRFVALALGGAVAVATLGWWAQRENSSGTQQFARVLVVTEPAGASVRFDGRLLDEKTPCELPRAAVGRYPLVFSLPGFRDHATQVDVPAQGVRALPPLALVRDRAPVPPPPVPQGVAPVQPEVRDGPAKVQVLVTSKPPEAQVSLDGVSQGSTPLKLELEPGSRPVLRLQKRGFGVWKQPLEVGTRGSVVKEVVLRPLPTRSGDERSRSNDDRRNPESTVVKMATVRFVPPARSSWGKVSCDDRELGETPLPDQLMTATTHRCAFVSDGKRITRTVEVLPSKLNKVFFGVDPSPAARP